MLTDFLSRRGFLTTTAAVPLAVGLSSASAAAARPSNMTFGFSLYGMRKLKTSDALSACARIGYDAVELVATSGWPCDPVSLGKTDRQSIGQQLKDLGLALPGIMENLHLVVDASRHRSNLDRLKRAAELGHRLSPQQPPVIETILGGRPSQWDTLKSQMVKQLHEWAKVAKASRTVIAIKAHVGGALHRPADARWLCDEVDNRWIRLAYDYSHFQLRNFVLEKSLKTMIDKTVFIHIKDTRGKADKFRFLLPGEGRGTERINYSHYLQLLKQHRYRGGMVVEVSGQIHGQAGYDPLKAATRSYQRLLPALRKVGLRPSAS